MANEEHLKILKQGVEVWNRWRRENPQIIPNLKSANLRGFNLCKADFNKVDLEGSILSGANLSEAQLNGAVLSEAKIFGANLRRANLRGSKIQGAELIQADLLGAELIGADLSRANLCGAVLIRAYLMSSNLSRADISEANIRGAMLNSANFREANLKGTDLRGTKLIKTDLSNSLFTGVKLYGTARDDWGIGGIKCDYVLWDPYGKYRFPKERDFRPGEFEEIYKSLPTIEYYFEHGLSPIDTVLMDKVVKAINEKNPEFELRLDSFHSRGQPRAVFTVFHRDVAEEALNKVKAGYESRIASLEAERDAIERCFLNVIEKPRTYIDYSERVEKGDKYNIQGQTGTVGPGAHAHDLNINQLWNKYSSEIDLKQLAGDLSNLRDSLIKKADEPEHYRAIAEVSEAEDASQANDGPKALEHLKKAGKWAFSVAENIGTTIAAEALKKAMGL